MPAESSLGGTYYTMLGISSLFKNDEFNAPERNMFRNNVLITDAVVQQANEMLGHTGSYQTSMPTAQVVKVGGYWGSSAAHWGTFRDEISIFRDSSQVPKDLVDLHGTSWLAEEEATKMEAFGQSTENHLLYGTSGRAGDTVDGTTPTAAPEKYDGLAVRYKTPDNSSGSYSPLNPDPATAAQPGVWDMGGSGTDTTSILFIRWGKRATSLITPKNDPQMGLQSMDKGEVREPDPNDAAKHRYIYCKEFEWKHGLSIYPGSNGGHHVARIRNIETALTAVDPALIRTIYQIIEEWFLNDTTGVMMYVPPRLRTHMDILLEAKMNVQFTTQNPYQVAPDQWANKVFIRTCRAISINETAVSAV